MKGETVAQEPEPVEAQGGRERSTILFPYGDQDMAVRVAKAIQQVGGTSCPMETLAAALKVEQSGGGFRTMIYTAKIFGLVTYGQGQIQLTTLGSQVADVRQEKTARVDAFMAVPLYKALYDRFKAGSLPPAAGLESEMVNLGVAKKQTDRARQSFQRSATQAGFFAYGTDRLVMPAVARGKEQQDPGEKKDETSGKRINGGGDDGSGRHQLIEGLIKTLPAEGSEWSLEERHRWLQLAAGIFDFVYKQKNQGGDRRVLKIELQADSVR